MRKFKLIKEYPGSPELNSIHYLNTSGGGKKDWLHWRLRKDNFGNPYILEEPWNYPEFWQELKEPILITEDGYECALDDRVFGVLPKANWQTNYYGEKGVPVFKLFNPEGKRWNPSSEWLWFKTKENAEEYIYENKPEFSKKDMLSFGASMSEWLYPYQCEPMLKNWIRYYKKGD